jgi:hypothetical protein
VIAQIMTPLAIGWPNGTGPTEGPTVVAQIMMALGIGWPDVIFLVLLLAFCWLLSVLAYQQAINHVNWFIYPLIVLLLTWGAIRLFGWHNSVIASVGLPLLVAGAVGVHFSERSKGNRTTRIEYARGIIEEITVDPEREVSREVWRLAERVLNGSKAEVIGSARTLANMNHALTGSERAFLLRLMTYLLIGEPSWRLQAANDVILSIKMNRMASSTGRLVDRAYRADQKVIREYLIDSFSLEEIKTLCADMDIDFDTLPGDGKEAKSRELVDYCYRHERLGELLGLCREQNPTRFGELPIAQPQVREPAPTPSGIPSNKVPLPPNVVAQLSSHVYAITCGYCRGEGRNPLATSDWKVIEYSTGVCDICKGKGTLRVETSDAIIIHGACRGTGLYQDSARYNPGFCPGCHGLGVCSLSGELKIIS